MGRGGGPRFRESERDGVLRSELPANESPRVRNEARTVLRREGRGPRRSPDPGKALEDDGPLLHERIQGRVAVAVPDQATRGECCAALGRGHAGWNAPQRDFRRVQPRVVDGRSRADVSGPERPHGPRSPAEAARDRVVDPREDRTADRPAFVPRRGVSDGGRTRGGADSSPVATHRPHRGPRLASKDHGPSVPWQIPHTSPLSRRDHASRLMSAVGPPLNYTRARALGENTARTEQREAIAFGSNRSTASASRRSRSAMTARRRSWDPSGSASRIPASVLSKYAKTLRTSSSKRPRLLDRNRSTSARVSSRTASIAKQ